LPIDRGRIIKKEDIYMKMIATTAMMFSVVALGFSISTYEKNTGGSDLWQVINDDVKMPDVVILGKGSKLGGVRFDHVSHNGGAYSITGTGAIGCTECHHAAQPAAELAKHPPLKTAWPSDRTTTLTAALFAKDPAAAGVARCADCHSPAGEKPKLLEKIPEIKHESSPAMISLNNQQAMHRSCAGCHTEVKKTNPRSKGPTTMQCTICHKRTN
jgi:hypothetical protein